ncbi:hypothetical protein FACS189465_0580 [Clostridia bacterium]|nr:hypothetical protein FACS189465_0580 [Clostridia bacterium]
MSTIKLLQKAAKSKRYIIILIFIILVFGLFVARLVDWQILKHDYYLTRANNTNTYPIKTDATRGEILDRNGVGLAVNTTGYRLVIDAQKLHKSKLNDLIIKAISLIEKQDITFENDFPIILENDAPKFKEISDTELGKFKKTIEVPINATANDCLNRLVKKYACAQFFVSEQVKISAVRYDMERLSGTKAKSTPYILTDKVSKENFSIISDHITNYENLRIEPFFNRAYENSDIAPHIIGYTGSMSNNDYEIYKKFNYSIDEKIGKSGIESVCEKFLKGKSGEKIIQRGKNGDVIRSFVKKENVAGNTVFLTIDSKLQEVACKSLAKNISLAGERNVKDCNSGAVVVLDVNDFSVLAAATYPSYDLNRFMNDSTYYPELLRNKDGKPLINRAFNGTFAPGSIYKPLVAIAALSNNVIARDETISCNGRYSHYRGYTLKCMGHHGHISIIPALARSCNVFFAELGRRLGGDGIKEYANRFGIGVKTGIELPESEGIVACKAYREKIGAHWYESGSSQAAIGQHDNSITPLQLATYAACIANGSARYETHIIEKITDFSRKTVIEETQKKLANKLEIPEEKLNIVKNGMREVVLSGTARDFKNFPIEIAAKTGTAENSGSDHTTFICFAPYENPKIAVSVVIANGVYGNISKNVARDILNFYFNLEEKN